MPVESTEMSIPCKKPASFFGMVRTGKPEHFSNALTRCVNQKDKGDPLAVSLDILPERHT